MDLRSAQVADDTHVRRCAQGLTGVTQCEDQQRYEQVWCVGSEPARSMASADLVVAYTQW